MGTLDEKFRQAFFEGIDLPKALRDNHADPEATRAEVARRIAPDTPARAPELGTGNQALGFAPADKPQRND